MTEHSPPVLCAFDPAASRTPGHAASGRPFPLSWNCVGHPASEQGTLWTLRPVVAAACRRPSGRRSARAFCHQTWRVPLSQQDFRSCKRRHCQYPGQDGDIQPHHFGLLCRYRALAIAGAIDRVCSMEWRCGLARACGRACAEDAVFTGSGRWRTAPCGRVSAHCRLRQGRSRPGGAPGADLRILVPGGRPPHHPGGDLAGPG